MLRRTWGESELEEFSKWDNPVYFVVRPAFRKLIEISSGKLRRVISELASGDRTDYKFHFCESIKILRFCFDGNAKYPRAAASEASGEND